MLLRCTSKPCERISMPSTNTLAVELLNGIQPLLYAALWSTLLMWTVVNSWVGVRPLPADFPFVFELLSGLLPVFQHTCAFVASCVSTLFLCVCVVPVAALSSLAFAGGYHSVYHYRQWSFHCWQLEQCRPSLASPPPLPLLWQLYIDLNHKYIFV